MTGTTVTRRIVGTAAPRHFNRPIAEAAYANIKLVGLPKWTVGEQAFARLVQKNARAEKQEGLAVKLKELEPPLPEPKSGGSDDIGDISWILPTITIRYPSNIPDLPGHNWSDAIAMATPIAHKGVVAGAKVVAMTMLDLLTRPELRTAARSYFTDVQTKNQKYVPMLTAADRPATESTPASWRPTSRSFANIITIPRVIRPISISSASSSRCSKACGGHRIEAMI
jgi:aminobenzoyl-glutamate utilization protein B